jgi:PleD family two-component response regulator
MMSPEKSLNRLLIIEEDPQLIEVLRQHFETEGYQIYTAGTGQDGLSLAIMARPALILLSAGMPDKPGLDVFRSLRDTARTAHIPVMVMAGRMETLLQNKVLEEGAYDFIEKPVDLDILTLRVRNALRRAEREGLTEPRTNLPTGRLIQERLADLPNQRGWYKIDVRIDGFSVFRDLYGFVTANEALRFAGNLIAQIVQEHGSSSDFVGHPTGTEEFVIITTQTNGPTLANTFTSRVSQELESFYNFVERDQGYVLVDDGFGGKVQKPLMSAQVKITQGEPDSQAPATSSSSDDVWVDAVDDGPPGEEPSGSPFEW